LTRQQREKRPASDALRHALCAAAGFLAAAASPFFPLLLLLPGAFAFLYRGMGRRFFITAAIVWAASCAVLYGLENSLFWYVFVLPTGLGMGIALTKQAAYRSIVAAAGVYFALCLYWQICLPSLLESGNPFAMAQVVMGSVFDQVADLAATASADASAVTAYFASLKPAIPALVTSGIIYLAMGCAGINVLLAHRLSRKAKAPLRPMAPLWGWRLGKGFFAGSAILAAGALALWLTKVSYAQAAISAIQAIVFAQLMLAGAGAVEFYLKRRPRGGRGARAAVIVAGVLLFPTSLYLLAGVGLFDYITKNPRRLPPDESKIEP